MLFDDSYEHAISSAADAPMRVVLEIKMSHPDLNFAPELEVREPKLEFRGRKLETWNGHHRILDGAWSFGGYGGGHCIQVEDMMWHVIGAQLMPQRVPLSLICHKGREKTGGAPRLANTSRMGSPSAIRNALLEDCAVKLAEPHRMQRADALVPSILTRSHDNPCGLPYRMLDGSHRACGQKLRFLEAFMEGAQSALSCPAWDLQYVHSYVLEPEHVLSLVRRCERQHLPTSSGVAVAMHAGAAGQKPSFQQVMPPSTSPPTPLLSPVPVPPSHCLPPPRPLPCPASYPRPLPPSPLAPPRSTHASMRRQLAPDRVSLVRLGPPDAVAVRLHAELVGLLQLTNHTTHPKGKLVVLWRHDLLRLLEPLPTAPGEDEHVEVRALCRHVLKWLVWRQPTLVELALDLKRWMVRAGLLLDTYQWPSHLNRALRSQPLHCCSGHGDCPSSAQHSSWASLNSAVAALEVALPAVRAEWAAAGRPAAVEDSQGLHVRGRWERLDIRRGADKDTDLTCGVGCIRCAAHAPHALPRTCSALDAFERAAQTSERPSHEAHPRIQNASFLTIQPSSELQLHAASTNQRLKVHCGLHNKGRLRLQLANVSIAWEELRCFVFDDSYEHRILSHSDQLPRTILEITISHPDLGTTPCVTDKRGTCDDQAPHT